MRTDMRCCGQRMHIEASAQWGQIMHCYECGHWEPYETSANGHYCGDPECEKCGNYPRNRTGM